MMKHIAALILALMMTLTLTFAVAEEAPMTVTLQLGANITTGYSWSGFVAGGSAVTLDSMEGTYIANPNPDNMDGVGGVTEYVLTAVEPGDAIIVFTYSRGWESDIAAQTVIFATVDADGILYTRDVTQDGVLVGSVIAVDAEEHAVMMTTEQLGEVVVRFAEEDDLPVEGEMVTVYTDGTMALSLPPIVRALAWAAVRGEMAR